MGRVFGAVKFGFGALESRGLMLAKGEFARSRQLENRNCLYCWPDSNNSNGLEIRNYCLHCNSFRVTL